MLAVTIGPLLITIGLVSSAVLLIGLVLLQKNRGSGLSGAFGGVGGHTAFGTKTGDFLTWVTVGLTAVFLLLSIVGNYVFEQPNKTAAKAAVQTPANPAAPMPDESSLPLPSTGTPVPASTPPPAAPAGQPAPVKVNPPAPKP